jgi:signal transduction histidine kinase
MRNTSMSLELSPALLRVRGDRVQLQQVVLNSVLNGLEAMRAPYPGARTLVIRTAPDGAAAFRVTVQDSGPGIAEKDLVHIFEPLYTTQSDGLGMGLAMVRTIVTAHGGAVGAENNPQGGTTPIPPTVMPSCSRGGDASARAAPRGFRPTPRCRSRR